jgi:transposase
VVALLDRVAATRPGGVGRPRKRPDSVTADKAYSSRANRAALRAGKITAVIPQPKAQIATGRGKDHVVGDHPLRPVRYRNQVERGFCRRKQWRGLATRYDKLGNSYQATGHSGHRRDRRLATRRIRPHHMIRQSRLAIFGR